ncbi:MAG: DUF4097 family beta strand repeat protein [Cyclobacteriaceae bacterium]|nr:DUF4097 family beta strand repeat protein [Cyclobacteriaceae bacterium]
MKTLVSAFFLLCAVTASGQTKDGIFQLDKYYKMTPRGIVKLSSSDAKVYITGSSRIDAHVKIYRQVTTKGVVFGQEEFTVDVLEEDGNLTIRERSNSTAVGMIGYHYEKYEITLEVPEGASLQIRGDDGDYRVRNVNGSISMDIDDADVELSACSGNEFRFRLDDGDIVMDGGKGKLDIDADDADVRITGAQFTSILADVDDGDFQIETTLADQGEYMINAQDGLVAMTITGGGGQFNVRHDDARVITEGDFKQVDRSEGRTTLVLANGNAKVDIRSDDARVRLVSR